MPLPQEGSPWNSSRVRPRSLVFRAKAPHPIRRVPGHRSDERTKNQDRSRSCRPLVSAWKQCGNQLNVVPDLFGGKRTGPLIAARDLRRQSTEGTTRAWIVSMRFVQIVVDQLCEGHRRSARFGSVHSTLPAAEGRADRFGNQIVTRIEVLVEPAYRKTCLLHQFCDSDPSKAFLAKSSWKRS